MTSEEFENSNEEMISDEPSYEGGTLKEVDLNTIAKWEAFFLGTDYIQQMREIADGYPDKRSVLVNFADLDLFDTDLAGLFLEHPDITLLSGKKAMKNLMHQEMREADINLRINNLPRDAHVEIRDLRAKHVGKVISVEGLVRKATEVRPKITDALFQCKRCGRIIKEEQSGLLFKEPMECYKEQDGCGRSAGATKFILLTEESRFVDTQKVEIQESPEGLRGGAQPERLTGYLEDDAAGSVAPGDRVTLNGILRSVQKLQQTKSTIFDISLDVISVESQRNEYEELDITPEDIELIEEAARSPDLFENIVASISPTIFGYDVEKECLALQLFGGVPKTLDDGTKIRGDIHILLIGDPGVAKCVTGDTLVAMADGSFSPIRELVDDALSKGPIEEIDDGVSAVTDLEVLTFSNRGRIEKGKAVRVWKRKAPSTLIRIITEGNKQLTVTPTHPLFTQYVVRIRPVPVSMIPLGTPIAAYTGSLTPREDQYPWEAGFCYDTLVSKEEIAAEEEWVYDLEVEDSHNFITNNIISHNSQMLRYMSRLAPRGIYASGKSSSAAGLCVGPESEILVDGTSVQIGHFVETHLHSPVEVNETQWREKIAETYEITSLANGKKSHQKLEAIWKIKTPSFLVEIEETNGHKILLTPETKLMICSGSEQWCKAADLTAGMKIPFLDDETNEVVSSTIVSVKTKQDDLPEYVYDLTVEDTHTFIANGFSIHNTAAAVKDDFGEGRWTLEAGALVLADLGQACIDELDKMTDQDRSSMHEAMESQTISVAKAGITATLQCRCSLLGAANPKYGRFEEHQYIADQINMPPALLSRFDLIFALTDKPSAEKDRNITNHILKAHRRGQVRKYDEEFPTIEGVDTEKILNDTSTMKPIFERDFFRKYVAYSKRVNPVMSDEAMKAISDYYLKIRKQGEGEGASVPITARQLEAFVRLSEASARARLSTLVTIDDARRAINAVEYYLQKIAGEGGQLDFDIVATGISHSQREQQTILKEIIKKALADADPRKGVSQEDICKLAAGSNIEETRTKSLLKRMTQSGELYSPTTGYYKMV
ncbi:ATP-binding protein [Candidatus Methanomassiliicoccus intestinalis]|uniref:ATP-binding protein n=1 Tax=Candidatus Methanomassiliicoccus intestinalis TaxID=1406512 RepID=UPI0037DCA8B9